MSPWGRAAVVAAAFALPGCKDDPPQSCGPSRPAFNLTLTASDGPLPENTKLEVVHGAGEEATSLDGPCLDSEVLYCTPSNRSCESAQDAADAADADGSVGPPPVDALVCELWIDGPAEVTVTARDYPDLYENLEVRRDGDCTETVDVELKLERIDGGR